jgi:hypothetical protein
MSRNSTSRFGRPPAQNVDELLAARLRDQETDPEGWRTIQTSGAGTQRIIAGTFDTNGTVINGAGFTCSHTSTGRWTVTWSTAFRGAPVVVSTLYEYGGITDVITCNSNVNQAFFACNWPGDGGARDRWVSFIAIGTT